MYLILMTKEPLANEEYSQQELLLSDIFLTIHIVRNNLFFV